MLLFLPLCVPWELTKNHFSSTQWASFWKTRFVLSVVCFFCVFGVLLWWARFFYLQKGISIFILFLFYLLFLTTDYFLLFMFSVLSFLQGIDNYAFILSVWFYFARFSCRTHICYLSFDQSKGAAKRPPWVFFLNLMPKWPFEYLMFAQNSFFAFSLLSQIRDIYCAFISIIPLSKK